MFETGSVALVTGAATGIGRATAVAFARAGCHLVLADRDGVTHRDPAAERQFAALHPMNRMGTAAEVAESVVWLCAPAAGFITGQALAVDGGLVAR